MEQRNRWHRGAVGERSEPAGLRELGQPGTSRLTRCREATASGALNDVRVLDRSRVMEGPYSTIVGAQVCESSGGSAGR